MTANSTPSSPRVFAVIAGGGTAGHMIPALAIAEQLVDRGRSPRSVAFVASKRPIDAQLLADTDHPRLFLNVDGLQRSFAPRALLRSLLAVPKLVVGTGIATRRFRQWQPRVVVSVGGFASEPAVRAARALRIPVVVVSYDQHPGLATRRQAKKAAAVTVAFAGSKLPGAKHAGAPVRHSVRRLVRNTAGDDTARRKAAEVFGIDPSRRVIVAMGGSLGSRTINDAVEKWVAANGARNDVAVLHLVGERYIDDASLGIRDGIQYVRRASHQNMADVWLLADVVVCRAGASTIAELITVGSAAVVVPWADAADDHQRLNASLLADSGAAIVVEERDVADRFAAELSRVVDDAILRERLVAKSYALGALNRSSAIGSIIEAAAR
ncbi:MAG: UDP-N-acetylglucosamine--N-acetylmuramyl-(pentapeptide) pyrophosphoryl-undecaprenol N-acetylglucosamine transferase [Ilumatobacteraceae bacterium]